LAATLADEQIALFARMQTRKSERAGAEINAAMTPWHSTGTGSVEDAPSEAPPLLILAMLAALASDDPLDDNPFSDEFFGGLDVSDIEVFGFGIDPFDHVLARQGHRRHGRGF
jgi:hypothetical protein